MGWLGIGAVAICSRRRRGAADLFVGRLVTKWAPGSSPHGDRTGAFGMEGRRGEWKGRNRTLAIGCLALASGSGQRVALVRNQPLVTWSAAWRLVLHMNWSCIVIIFSSVSSAFGLKWSTTFSVFVANIFSFAVRKQYFQSSQFAGSDLAATSNKRTEDWTYNSYTASPQATLKPEKVWKSELLWHSNPTKYEPCPSCCTHYIMEG